MHIATSSIPEAVRHISAALSEAGHKSWIVGGCVRDLLRNRAADISDWDLTTDAMPEKVMNLFPKVVPTGLQHGTVTVMVDGVGYEVTTLRGEGAYSDGRRPDSVFFVTDIVEDLARRDFTVNAIAADPISGEVTDPFGGVDDLEDKLLRAVGDANARFSEDGLRVLRAARFCAVLGFDLDEGTKAAIRPNLETFSKVAKERVLAEWVKAIEKSEEPSVAFRIMRETGILETVGGPLARLSAEEFDLAMRNLDAVPRDFSQGMAAMLLPSESKPEGWLREIKVSNTELELISKLWVTLRDCVPFKQVKQWPDAQVRRWASKVGVRYLPEVLMSYLSNPFFGSPEDADALSWRFSTVLGPKVALELKGLDVSGDELQKHLGIPPSRKLGELLKALLEFVLDDPQRNEKEILLSHAQALHSGAN